MSNDDNDNGKPKRRRNPGDFQRGNVAAMKHGAHGALKRMEQGIEQRRDVLELKAERLHEFERTGRLGWLIDRLAELDTLAELFGDRARYCYNAGDIDGLYRASKEIRGLVRQMKELLTEHRNEEGAGGPVLDYEQVLARQKDTADA